MLSDRRASGSTPAAITSLTWHDKAISSHGHQVQSALLYAGSVTGHVYALSYSYQAPVAAVAAVTRSPSSAEGRSASRAAAATTGKMQL